MREEDFEEKTLERQEIFKGKIIEVVLDKVALPKGGTSFRELVFHPGGVAVIPITADNKIILVKQFRKPMEQVLLEIPAGKIDPGEQQLPEVAAARELEEEIGMRAQELRLVTAAYLSPGFANEKLYIYFADQLERVENPRPQDPDEVLELHELTLAEAKTAIASGAICDIKTVCGIQYWELETLKRRLGNGSETADHES
ncbi:ADP-ribose pyrophosphatase [Enterococcus canis]|uniref:ADP-ribose pyrophosphatase n=2 Tax=Enterococcus canis TaxID=214095 RepID=A0A1L8RH46_9ENTE|nr:ADP-ribose pyrophosphatase [Enterococcus canis]